MAKTYLTVSLAVLSYGLYYPAIAFLLLYMSPLVLGAFRLFMASLIFLILIAATSSWQKITRRAWPHLLILAICGYFLNAVIYNFGIQFCDAITGALVFSLSPLLSAIFARLILKEDFSGWKVIGSLIALSGVFFVVGKGMGPRFSIGIAILFLGAAGYGFAMISAKYAVKELGALCTTGYATAMAAVIAVPLALVVPGEIFVAMPASNWLLLVATGFILVINIFWNRAIQVIGVVKTTVFNNISPVIAMLASAVFLNQEILLVQIGGALLILLGVSAVVLSREKEGVSPGTSRGIWRED